MDKHTEWGEIEQEWSNDVEKAQNEINGCSCRQEEKEKRCNKQSKRKGYGRSGLKMSSETNMKKDKHTWGIGGEEQGADIEEVEKST